MTYYAQPAPNSWDPLVYEHEEPSPFCLARLKKEISDFCANPLVGVFIFPEEANVTKVHALIVGPTDTLYEGGFFHFLIKFSQDYPITPPRVRFMTTDGGRVGFTGNLFASGRVSLSILGNFEGPKWGPVLGLENILIWLQSLFFIKTHYIDDYNYFTKQETIRVAVCGTVEAALQDRPDHPEAMQKHILKYFSESYSKYVGIVNSHLDLTGRAVCSTYGLEGQVFRFQPLLTRLEELKQMVEKKIKADGGGTKK